MYLFSFIINIHFSNILDLHLAVVTVWIDNIALIIYSML